MKTEREREREREREKERERERKSLPYRGRYMNSRAIDRIRKMFESLRLLFFFFSFCTFSRLSLISLTKNIFQRLNCVTFLLLGWEKKNWKGMNKTFLFFSTPNNAPRFFFFFWPKWSRLNEFLWHHFSWSKTMKAQDSNQFRWNLFQKNLDESSHL